MNESTISSLRKRKALNEHVMYNITEIFTFQIKEVMKHFVRVWTTIMTLLFFFVFYYMQVKYTSHTNCVVQHVLGIYFCTEHMTYSRKFFIFYKS